MGPGSHECPLPLFQSQSPPQQAAGAAGAKLRDPRTQAAQGPSLARRDLPHRCRPAQGKPPCPTSVGRLALRHSGGTSPPGRKSQAVTSWPSAPGGAVPSLGSRTRVPAPHHRSTRSGPSQLRASTNTTTAPAAATRGRHAPASRSEAVYPSLGQQLGMRDQSAGHCRPGGGAGARREATGHLNAGGQGRQARQGSPRGTGHRWGHRAAARPGPALSRGGVSHPLPSRSFPVQPQANQAADHGRGKACPQECQRHPPAGCHHPRRGVGGTRPLFQVQSSSAGTQRRGQRWPPC